MTVKANLIHREVERMKAYEAVYIFDPALSEDQANELKEKVSSIITQSNGVLHEVRYWGKRRFTYLIEKKRDGHYFLFIFDADESVPEQLNHFARVNETVLRNMIIKRTPPSRRRNKKQEMKAKLHSSVQETPITVSEPARPPVEAAAEPLIEAPIEAAAEPLIEAPVEELNLAVDVEVEEGVVADVE
jgi:small subunit ribosomal protein S6